MTCCRAWEQETLLFTHLLFYPSFLHQHLACKRIIMRCPALAPILPGSELANSLLLLLLLLLLARDAVWSSVFTIIMSITTFLSPQNGSIFLTKEIKSFSHSSLNKACLLVLVWKSHFIQWTVGWFWSQNLEDEMLLKEVWILDSLNHSPNEYMWLAVCCLLCWITKLESYVKLEISSCIAVNNSLSLCDKFPNTELQLELSTEL